MESYSRAALERAMKVQEVMLQAMAKKITWFQAAEIIGISDRHMRRWRERYEEGGFRALFDRRRGKPSPKRVRGSTVEHPSPRQSTVSSDIRTSGHPRFLLRGTGGAQTEISLATMDYIQKRILNVLSGGQLRGALAA
jgi:hypothetical protein